MELKLGKMTNKELAEWFGIQLGSFKSRKKSKLEELKAFAEFEEVYGGANIIKIIEPVYSKKGSQSKQIIFDEFLNEWDKSGLDTVNNVTDKIYFKRGNELTVLKSTGYQYALEARNEYFGKPYLDMGKLGKCMYVWCKKEVTDEGVVVLTLFNEEEQAIKKELMTKYFKTDEEKDVMLAEMVKAGEITKEQAYDKMAEMRGLNEEGFLGFKAALEEALGASVVKGTVIEKNVNFNKEKGMKFLNE